MIVVDVEAILAATDFASAVENHQELHHGQTVRSEDALVRFTDLVLTAMWPVTSRHDAATKRLKRTRVSIPAGLVPVCLLVRGATERLGGRCGLLAAEFLAPPQAVGSNSAA